jgi:hypothetical protein
MLVYWHTRNWQSERMLRKETVNVHWIYSGLLSLSDATEFLTTDAYFNLGLR